MLRVEYDANNILGADFSKFFIYVTINVALSFLSTTRKKKVTLYYAKL